MVRQRSGPDDGGDSRPGGVRDGSPPTEAGRHDDEIQHKKRIGRTFALAAKSVTVEQYPAVREGLHDLRAIYTRTAEFPVMGMNWYRRRRTATG